MINRAMINRAMINRAMINRAMINRAMNSLIMINRGHMMKTVIQLLCPQPFIHYVLLQLSLFQTAIGL